jgi:hypothetical protein
MKSMILCKTAAIALLLIGMTQVAEASILGGMFNYGQLNVVRDDSVGVLNNGTGDLFDPQVGDVLQGIFAINNVDNVFVQDASIWGIYSLQVTKVTAGAFGPLVELGVPTAGFGNRIDEIMTGLGLATPAYSKSGSMADSTLVVVETGSVVDLPNFDGDFFSTLDSVIDATWSADMVLGLVDAVKNYHEVQVIAPLFNAGFSLSYSVIADAFGAGITYDETTGLPRYTTNLPGVGDFTTTNIAGIGLTPPTDASIDQWQFSDKADFQIQPTPEPASLVVWAAIAGGLGLVARRRLLAV